MRIWPRSGAGVLVLLAGLAVLVAAEWQRSARAERALVADLAHAVELLAPHGERLLTLSAAEADAEIRRWAEASGARVTLIDAHGRVVADSWTLPGLLDRLEDHSQRPEIVAAATAGGVGVARRRSATTDRPLVYVARLVGPPGRGSGFVRLAREEARWRIPWAGLGVALLAAFAAELAARSWATRAHARVARHLIAWAGLPSVAALEALAEESDRRFREVRETLTRELEATRSALAEIDEGVVLVDGEGMVRYCNPAARRLLGADLGPGHALVEAARAPELVGAVSAALASRAARHTTVSLPGGGELAVRVRPLPHPVLAAAMVLRDTSGERQHERARRALVADLAHELRTPLTVLGALVEELGEAGAHAETVATLERQVRRLRTFAEDLEELAAIESGQVRLHLEPLAAATVVRQVLEDVRPEAEAAGITLVAEGDAPLVTDAVRLAQVLTNLVENGIRYNRPGGQVTVRVEPVESAVRIHVEDDGVGIPTSEIPLVFQRFYRVRRGAGPQGGSGLGLAIVKHLVRALGGTVELASREGAGTTVTLTFPASAVKA